MDKCGIVANLMIILLREKSGGTGSFIKTLQFVVFFCFMVVMFGRRGSNRFVECIVRIRGKEADETLKISFAFEINNFIGFCFEELDGWEAEWVRHGGE